MVSAARLDPADLVAIEPQASQRFTIGIDTQATSIEEAELLAAQPEAWAIYSAGRLIACFGIRETFPGRNGVAWAVLAEGIGSAHLAMTRFARHRIEDCGLARVEAIVRGPDAEGIVDAFPGLDNGQLLDAVLTQSTPEMVWARLVGLRPAHVLRKYGGFLETHVLFERIG